MLTYRLINTLNSAEDSKWKNLLTTSLGDRVIHPKRAQGFCLAREALKRCLAEYKIMIDIPQLIIENFHAVAGQASLTISLSHCQGWGAAVAAEVNQFRSVGIDIEPLDRVVKTAILERISHPWDIKLPPLSIWCLKEAGFKAIMNTQQFEHPVEFSTIQIKENSWIHHSSQIQGEWKLFDEQGLIIALAWIKI